MVWLYQTKICRKSKSVDMDGFIVYTKTEDICVYIAKDFETRFDTSNYEL